MLKRTITHGQIYTVRFGGQNAGAAVPFDETWSAAMRVTKKQIGGEVVDDIPLALTDGKFVAVIDTAEEPWEPGVYAFDARITGPSGKPRWTDPVLLTLTRKNSPES